MAVARFRREADVTPSLLSLYVGRRFTTTLVSIIAAVALIIFVADYVEVLRKFSDQEGYTTGSGLILTGLRLPLVMDTLLPFAFLFAAMLSLLGLSRSLELVVARASGVSVWRFMATPLLVALVLGALATTVVNPLAVEAQVRADILEARMTGPKTPRKTGYWFRQNGPDGSSIIHSDAIGQAGALLSGVTAFLFTAEGKFDRKVTAESAELAGGRWVFAKATIVSAAGPPHQEARLELPTDLDAKNIATTFFGQRTVSFWSLPALIELVSRTGRKTDAYVLAYHELISRPLFFAAMVAIAATVSLRLTRYGRVWRLILTGVAGGFLLYVMTKIVRDLGANGILDPILAAWLPPIVALTFGATALLYQEDG